MNNTSETNGPDGSTMNSANTNGKINALPFAITLGEGRKNPQGIYLPCEPSVRDVAERLRNQPQTIERWWSLHLWKDNKRKSDAWYAASGVMVDIDYRTAKENPPRELIEKLWHAAANDELPGSLFHLTPHGARIVWVFGKINSNPDLQKKAERGAGVLVAKTLERLGLTDYEVDQSTLGDLARFFYTPGSIAKGVKRDDSVMEMRPNELVKPDDLASHDIEVEPKKTKTVKPANAATSNYRGRGRLVEAFEKRGDIGDEIEPGKYQARCPWERDHTTGETWDGSTIIYEADPAYGNLGWFHCSHKHCKDREINDVIRLFTDEEMGNHRAVPSTPPPSADGETSNGTSSAPASDPPKKKHYHRPLRNRSYFTAVDIISENKRDVLDGCKLELNEMSGDIELGRVPIKDADVYRIRYNIEKLFAGGETQLKEETGLQIAIADIHAAVSQVASGNPYHPVREYLNGLKWDGQPHIAKVAGMLGADDSDINRILIRRFFISAVARALDPGCKVDTVFILVGGQGAKKSSFFEALAGNWFVDTPIDISGDIVRAYMTLRKAWILEWAELEAMFRARRATAVKSFLTSRSDSYVPKYARYSIEVKRGGVIVGTTNPMEFLDDETGERRYWPITVGGDIDLDAVKRERDQLWAEAVHLYRAPERWWLDKAEEALLAPRHAEHKASDAWDDIVLEYAENPREVTLGARGDVMLGDRVPLSTANVLEHGLRKPRGQWQKSDEMRVAKILKLAGYKQPPRKHGQPRTWSVPKPEPT